MGALTANVDPAFDRAFLSACASIGCDPTDLLSVMMSESDCNPAAHNPNGDASGLIQFMPATLTGLGYTAGSAAFRALTASAQLPYVVAYYRPWLASAGAWDSAGRLYQATFLPATLATARAPEDTLCAKGGVLGWAYLANSVFDRNGDARITIQELTDATHRAANADAGRYHELLSRLGLPIPNDATIGPYTPSSVGLDSAKSVQHALNVLGYGETGLGGADLDEDGIIGPKSQAAIRAFQTDAEIHIDGIAGPETRAALAAAIAASDPSE